MPAALPPDERQAIIDAIRAGGKRNQIARDFGRSPGTVTRIAEQEGITDAFDRTSTKRATELRQIDNRAVREVLKARAYAEAGEMLDRLRRQYVVHSFDKSMVDGAGEYHKGGLVTGTLDEPPASEVRNYSAAFGILVDKAVALDRVDSGDDGTKGLLEQLVEGLRPPVGREGEK